ncbi:MAG: hypothetical protein QM730_08825 [Anaerolineales bacterium]
MKKQTWGVLGLALLLLACKTLQPTPLAPTATQPIVVTSTSTTTPAPSSTASPLPTATEMIPTHTPRPTPPPITCSDDSCLNACLKRINQALPQVSFEPLGGAYSGDDIQFNLVSYDVKEGQLGEPQFLYVPDEFKAYQQDTVTQQEVWQYAFGLLPDAESDWLVGYEVFTSSYYSAWVRPSGSDNRDRAHWVLGMDIVDSQDPVDLTYTLVHEYGHLITLNTDQIPASDFYYGWSQNPAVCKQFLSPDGCSKPDSYINLFYQKFWKDIFPEWEKDVLNASSNSSDEYRALIESFYNKHSDQFIREYAATNIHEDLAESFTYFVLEPEPSGYNVDSKKIRFFYNFPELVQFRKQMIQNICSYTQ